MTDLRPNPHDPPGTSWAAPIAAGVLATLLLHSPVLWSDLAWLAICFTCGCSGAPVGAVPVLLALRRDPFLSGGSAFALAFMAVGIGSVMLAVAGVSSFELHPEVIDNVRASLREEGFTGEEIDESVAALRDAARFFPVIAAGLMALMGGLTGALTAAIAGRRRPPPWPPVTPGPPPPPA